MLRFWVSALGFSLVSLVLAWPASAQVTAGEMVAFHLETPHPYISSGAATPRMTWFEEVRAPGATYIALHFSHFDLAEGDRLVVRSPSSDQYWTYEDLGRRGLGRSAHGFFATHIKGEAAVLELWTSGDTSSYGFQIDRYGRGFNLDEIRRFWDQGQGLVMNLPELPEPDQAICTVDDSVEAKCLLAESEVYEKSRSVVRLLKNGSEWCTGWLVGCEGHVMTNQHCITDQAELDTIDFEFLAEGVDCLEDCRDPLACPGVIEASGGTFIAGDFILDYGLVLPDTSVAQGTDLPATYGYQQLRETSAIENEQIYIPQHPAGWGKRIAYSSTYPEDLALGGGTYLTGLEEFACRGGASTDLGYWADTRSGSSGSPVIAAGDHLVVGLHRCRGGSACSTGDPSQDDRNLGVKATVLIEDLGDFLPACARSTGVFFSDDFETGDLSGWPNSSR